MSVKLLTEQHLEFLSLKGGCTGLMSLHLSKFHIVGNHMSRLNCLFFFYQSLQLGKALSNLLSYRDYLEIVLVASLFILLFRE